MIKPGDIIEWKYKQGTPANLDETIWSTTMERWVPVGRAMVHLLVASVDGTIMWINPAGLFTAEFESDVAGDSSIILSPGTT